MSDGSLSQDEIDALLQGSDGFDFATGTPPQGEVIAAAELDAFKKYIAELTDTQASNLSMIVGKTVSIGAPVVEVSFKEEFLSALEQEVIQIDIDFTNGFAAQHSYFMDKGLALAIAGAMLGQAEVELNDVALSSINEAFSQITGPAATVMGDRVGSTVMTQPPDGKSIPKAAANLPPGAFIHIRYPLSIEGSQKFELHEVYEIKTAEAIARKGKTEEASLAATAGAGAGFAEQPSGAAQPPQGSYTPQQGGYPPQQGGYPPQGYQQQGGYPPQGYPQQGGYPPAGYPPAGYGQMMPGGTNVQPVQFPNLAMGKGIAEQGNIGLLMDVYMEMTVELGRTKKLIKEILGMGEGTIIELDKLAGEPVDILVNHKLIAKGEVVVIDENFGVRVTEIVSPMERVPDVT